ncbi:hypothetical protein [Anaerosporobacter sp.]|uniref:hypothetical protein n=1 Tax=Anaerosporobacter sp. TaxID=1872529 RepID=UPI00286EC879|nr:hypothetical protein [Anaerosporobacter sp.]
MLNQNSSKHDSSSHDNALRSNAFTPKAISLCGIFLVFTLVFLFLAGSITNIQMVSYCLSSIFIIIVLEESNLRVGIAFYVASSLLALLVLPNKLAIVPYILFFGHYGLWYYWYTKTKKKYLVHIINYIVANIGIFTTYFTCKELFVTLKIPALILFVPIVEVFIFLFDHMYGRCLFYYRRDIRSKIS